MVLGSFGRQKTKPNKANLMVRSCSFLVLCKDKESNLKKQIQFIFYRGERRVRRVKRNTINILLLSGLCELCG